MDSKRKAATEKLKTHKTKNMMSGAHHKLKP
jgi:hypothetical protein